MSRRLSAAATFSIPRIMIPFFLLLLTSGYSMFRFDMIPTVSGNSDPYLTGKNLAAAMANPPAGVDLLSPPFCDLPMEGATLEHQMFAASTCYLPSASVRRGNSSAYCAAVRAIATDRLIVVLGDVTVDGSEPLLSLGSFRGLFVLLGLYWIASLIIAGLWWWFQRARARGRGDDRDEELGREVTAPRRYRYREVAAAAGNFAESRRIGRGGFGAVYRGVLNDAGVAVKVLSPESAEQGRREFEAEVRIIGRLRHRNLVQLLGWCDGRKGLLLVYELVPEGSLDKHLHSPDRLLSWQERYTIALDLGAAILYLHTECEQCVVHGDIKPSNVMLLGSPRRAKLGDFGMARLVDHGAEPQTTQVVAGTVGYIDPEFVTTRRPSTESDVYSFGVVLLEIASGKRPTCRQPTGEAPAALLLRHVRDLHGRGTILDAADGRLDGEFDREQMECVLVTGLWCAHRDPSQRPSITQAMAALRCQGGGMPALPELLHGGTVQIGDLEEEVYRDLLSDDEVSPSTRSSPATAYHTPEDSCHLDGHRGTRVSL